MANSIFKDGGGAGIGSYVVVFKNGELAPETSLLKLRRAYEAGESIFFSVIDIETKDALVPASGWIDEEGKLHLVARDFDDAKTYSLVFDANPIESEIDVHAEVKDGIDLAGEDIPSWDQIESALAEKADLVDGKIPAEELPSYVDDVEEYEDLEHFPAEGEQGKIYVASDTGLIYRWSGTQYIQIGGSDLSAGDGINIADHIVSADMEYLNEHLNFVTPDEVENDIEVIGYQNQTPISEEQLEKAVAGKLVIKHNNRLYVKHFQTADMINFHTFEIGRNIGSSVTVNTTLRSMEYVIILLRSTRMLSDSGAMPVTAVGDDGDNFLAAGTAPAADGKKVIRELNLQPALEGKADKPLNTIQFDIPEGWDGDYRQLLENQDSQLIKKFMGGLDDKGINGTPVAIYDQLGNWYEFTPTSEVSAGILIKPNQGDGENSEGAHVLLRGDISLEIDPETGDEVVLTTELVSDGYALGSDIGQLSRELGNKQNTLVSGSNIKTVNGNSVLGEGDITISSGTEWTVITSSMTDAERATALASATLPYVIFQNSDRNFILSMVDSTWYYFVSITSAIIPSSTPKTISFGANSIKINKRSGQLDAYGVQQFYSSSSVNSDNTSFPTGAAVRAYVASQLKIETLSNISSGDTIPTGNFWTAVTKHKEIELNGVRLYYMNDDGTNYEYGTMTMNGANIHLNLVTFNKTTHVVTFNTVTTGDYYTKSEVDAAIQAAIGNAIGGGY